MLTSISYGKINKFPIPKLRYVVDLGLDLIHQYHFDDASGKIAPLGTAPALHFPSGSGPRHMAFHPSGEYAVAITEKTNMLVLMKHNAKTGELSIVEEIASLPSGYPAGTRPATTSFLVNSSILLRSSSCSSARRLMTS
jgi:6-phosphogluconolactonase